MQKRILQAAGLIVLLLISSGCFEQQVKIKKNLKEDLVPVQLRPMKTMITQWQTVNMNKPLPDDMHGFTTMAMEMRMAKEAPHNGYHYEFLPESGKGKYYVVAYPSGYDVTGIKTYFMDQTGGIRSKDLGKDFDHSQWDYEKAKNNAR